jgi:hypothetical protein
MDNPDPASGLYIRTRTGQNVRVVIPPTHIAYQMGEAMQVCPETILLAHELWHIALTSHCVFLAICLVGLWCL